jgi:hypothetical protein
MMPIGLPAAGADPVNHYNNLQTRLSVAVDASNVTQLWVTDADAFSGLFAMCKGFLRYFPVGSTAPDGTTLASPMLVLKTWLWDYIALRNNVTGGVTLPKLVSYGNVDSDEVRDAVHAEFTTNSRYQSMSLAERTQAETDFMASDAQMLVSPATMLGRGAIESAGTHVGQRRLDLTFLGHDLTNLDPHYYFDLWGLVGGPQVRNHPLMQALARPVTPSQMPSEGNLRIRVTGTGFTSGTTVQIAGQPATDVAINATGTAVYATSPAMSAGAVDVIVTIPTQPAQVYIDALTFTDDLLATVRAATLAYAVALTEIQEQADALAASSALGDPAREELRIAMDMAGKLTDNAINARCHATAGSLFDPALSEVWENANNDLMALKTGILTTIA